MKKILFLVPFLTLLWGGWGCDNKEPSNLTGTVFSKNYVQIYQKVSSFTARYRGGYQAIQIDVAGEAIGYPNPGFTELADYFDDTSYNQYMTPGQNQAILTEIESIEAVSDTDFSAVPAGQSLGNAVKLYSFSAYKFLISRYTQEFDWLNNTPEEFKTENWGGNYDLQGDRGYHPVIKPIAEITAEDLFLIEPRYFFLRFTEIPAIKQHLITVTLKIEGQELTAVVDVDFDDTES